MRRTRSLLLVGVLAAAVPVDAGAKKDRPDPFAAFEEELLQTTGVDEADEKALKQIRRCGQIDDLWQRHLQDPRTYALHETRDEIRSSVACWEKVRKKHPTGHEGVDEWVVQWLGFVKGVELWVWARMAIELGERDNFCTRIAATEEQLDLVAAGAADLPGRFTTAGARDLAGAPAIATSEVRTAVRKHRADSGCE